jgi:hypothetical protein
LPRRARWWGGYRAWSADLPPPAAEPLPRLGPYSCDEVVGTGGTGTVYRAHRDDVESLERAKGNTTPARPESQVTEGAAEARSSTPVHWRARFRAIWV